MSMLARSSLRAARGLPVARQQVRMFHPENTVGHTLPISVKNKPATFIKVFGFGIVGFGIPFFAAYFQLSKKSG